MMSRTILTNHSYSSGISSLTFTKAGEALYLHSSSELQRISLSAAKVTKAHCALNLPPNARVTPEAPATEQPQQDGNTAGQDNEATEDSAETEKDTSATNEQQVAPKIITENGVVGSSK